MGPYAGVGYTVSPYVHSKVASKFQHIYNAQPYARVDYPYIKDSVDFSNPSSLVCFK